MLAYSATILLRSITKLARLSKADWPSLFEVDFLKTTFLAKFMTEKL